MCVKVIDTFFVGNVFFFVLQIGIICGLVYLLKQTIFKPFYACRNVTVVIVVLGTDNGEKCSKTKYTKTVRCFNNSLETILTNNNKCVYMYICM